MVIIYGILFLVVYFLLNGYIGYNLYTFIDVFGISVDLWAIIGFVMFLSLSYVLARIPIPFHNLKMGLKVLGSYYFAIFEYLLIALPISNILYVIGVKLNFDAIVLCKILGVLNILFLLIFIGYGSYLAWSTVIRKYEIKIPKKVDGNKKIVIAMASDLHLGDIVGRRHLQKLVNKMNSMNPDLILFPGDVLDDAVQPFIQKNMASILKEAKATYGEYAVLGNHEYIGGNIPRYVEEMSSINIPVLQDEVIRLHNGIYIVGRKDKTAERVETAGRKSFEELLENIPKDAPVIAMDHQPYAFSKAEEAGVDLLLCGHTHRGQFSPNHLVTKKIFELDWGYIKKKTLHVVVSSGYGTWGPPIRLGSQSEIIEITVCFTG